MKALKRYLNLQSKRTLKSYIGILALTMVLLLSIVAVGYGIMLDKKSDGSFKRISLGIVGDKSDKLFDMGIELIKKTDTSKLTVDFYEYTSEQDAIRDMKSGKLNAYVVVPADFAKSIIRGDNKKLNYVMAKSVANMSSSLTREVVDVVSNYIIETQAGVTAMCDYAEAKGSSNSQIKSLDIDMSMEYIGVVTGRESLAEILESGLGGTLSTVGYYVCGLTVFFIMGFGIANCILLVKNDRSLQRLLYSRGYNTPIQIIGEYLPFFVSAAVTLEIVALLIGAVLNFVDISVPEFEYFIMTDYTVMVLKLIPAILLITAMQFMLYELVTGVINSVLLQFIVAVILGYISGCFYPIYFFPDAVQKIASILPTGVAMNYFSGILTANIDPVRLIVCIVYAALFIAVAVTVRKIRVSAREGQ